MAKSPQAPSSDASSLTDNKPEHAQSTSAAPKTQPSSASSSKARALSEIVEDSLSPFDHQTAIFLLDLLLETHAWAAARPKHESARAVGKYEKKIADILDVEKEQGTFPLSLVDRMRARLLEFTQQMKNAVAALTTG
ncbi:hypothetical protein HDZ31DRAFT_65868 [Schizophyllum fasciatum]